MYRFQYLKKFKEVKVLKDGLMIAVRRNINSISNYQDLEDFVTEWFNYRNMTVPNDTVIEIVD